MVPFSYQNQSKNMVILRCIGPNRFFLEKVILSYERFSLMAPQGSKIEIWGNSIDGIHLEERIRLPQNTYEIKEFIAA